MHFHLNISHLENTFLCSIISNVCVHHQWSNGKNTATRNAENSLVNNIGYMFSNTFLIILTNSIK